MPKITMPSLTEVFQITYERSKLMEGFYPLAANLTPKPIKLICIIQNFLIKNHE